MSNTEVIDRKQMTVGTWLDGCKNEVMSTGKMFAAVLKPQYPGLDDAEILRSFWASLHAYLMDKDYLWGCDPISIQLAGLKAAQRGLDFAIENEVHLVPYKNKATMQPGYKGELKMARRSDSVAFIDAFDVRANDFIEIEFGDTPKVTHKIPKFGEPRGDVIGFYCVARDRRGNSHIEMMTNAETIEHYSRFTQAKNRGPFAELNTKGAKHPNFIPYGLKTVIHRICRRKLDLSREQAQQYAEDDRVNRMIVQPAAAGIVDATNGAILNLPIPESTEETTAEQTSAEKTQALLADMKAKTEKDSVLPSKEEIAAGKGDKPAA